MLRALPEAPSHWDREADVVVVGAGAAGLSAALAAADAGRRVFVVSKGHLGSGSTPWAQGGLAAVIGADDSFGLHARDTRTSGAGLCDDASVMELTHTAPGEIEWLIRLGAHFDGGAETRELSLAREGGHSRHRVVHAGGDASGAEVSRVLRSAAELHRNIDFLEPAVALDLHNDSGMEILIGTIDPETRALDCGAVRTRSVIIATGGAGQTYQATTNPRGSSGDGLALAARAGATISDIEFVQFHPTVLFTGALQGTQRPLITEALRGEGAQLLDVEHRRFMPACHPAAELAPRDVVAAAMHDVMSQQGADHLWLDATMVAECAWRDHFPTVFRICRDAGIDPRQEPIPVTPGAHYFCGGVRTDLDGRTSLPNVFAVGEVACTGVHGANRLASNSLTEALHFGRRAGLAAAGATPTPATAGAGPIAGCDIGMSDRTLDRGATAAIRTAMARHVSVQRNAEGLRALLDGVEGLAEGRHGDPLTLDDVEATSIHTVALLVATAALMRTESRGCHRRSDYPQASKRWRGHIGLAALNHTALERRIPA